MVSFYAAAQGYAGLDSFLRGVINHAIEYVNGAAHTIGLENIWSLLDAHAFRYNDCGNGRHRGSRGHSVKSNDAERLEILAAQLAGKRLTYEGQIGNGAETER